MLAGVLHMTEQAEENIATASVRCRGAFPKLAVVWRGEIANVRKNVPGPKTERLAAVRGDTGRGVHKMTPTRSGNTRVVVSSPTRSAGLNSKNKELSRSNQARPTPRWNVGPLLVLVSPKGTYAPPPPST